MTTKFVDNVIFIFISFLVLCFLHEIFLHVCKMQQGRNTLQNCDEKLN